MELESTYKFTPQVLFPDITPSTSMREVLKLGLEFTREQNVDALTELRQQFIRVTVPLCTSNGAIKELQIPRRHDQSQIKDLAPLLSPAQGEKFCEEFFDLMIPSLHKTGVSIAQAKNGAALDQEIKMGWFSKFLFKILYRSIDTNDLPSQMANDSNLVWKDDDKKEVEKIMRVR